MCLGEGTDAGSYFYHVIVAGESRGFDNRFEDIRVNQEMLPEPFSWKYSFFGEYP